MGTWSSRGLRGSTLEDMINMTNEQTAEACINSENSHTHYSC